MIDRYVAFTDEDLRQLLDEQAPMTLTFELVLTIDDALLDAYNRELKKLRGRRWWQNL